MKTLNEEVSSYLASLLRKTSSLAPQKVYISAWKGVDDIKDNLSGVSIINESGNLIGQEEMIQLNCDNNYLEIAKLTAELLQEELIQKGFIVSIKTEVY